MSKIGPIENFDFWSKVNAKSQSQLVRGQSQRILVRVSSGFSSRATGRAVDLLTSSCDMSLTWTRADVDMLAWLLTWINDVIIWRQTTSVVVSARGKSVQCLPACGGVARNPGGVWRSSQKPRWRVVACATLYDHQILKPSRSVDDKAILAARVIEI